MKQASCRKPGCQVYPLVLPTPAPAGGRRRKATRLKNGVCSLQESGTCGKELLQGSFLHTRGLLALVSGQQRPSPQYAPAAFRAGSLRLPQATPSIPLRQSQNAWPLWIRVTSSPFSDGAATPNKTEETARTTHAARQP